MEIVDPNLLVYTSPKFQSKFPKTSYTSQNDNIFSSTEFTSADEEYGVDSALTLMGVTIKEPKYCLVPQSECNRSKEKFMDVLKVLTCCASSSKTNTVGEQHAPETRNKKCACRIKEMYNSGTMVEKRCLCDRGTSPAPAKKVDSKASKESVKSCCSKTSKRSKSPKQSVRKSRSRKSSCCATPKSSKPSVRVSKSKESNHSGTYCVGTKRSHPKEHKQLKIKHKNRTKCYASPCKRRSCQRCNRHCCVRRKKSSKCCVSSRHKPPPVDAKPSKSSLKSVDSGQKHSRESLTIKCSRTKKTSRKKPEERSKKSTCCAKPSKESIDKPPLQKSQESIQKTETVKGSCCAKPSCSSCHKESAPPPPPPQRPKGVSDSIEAVLKDISQTSLKRKFCSSLQKFPFSFSDFLKRKRTHIKKENLQPYSVPDERDVLPDVEVCSINICRTDPKRYITQKHTMDDMVSMFVFPTNALKPTRISLFKQITCNGKLFGRKKKPVKQQK